MSSLALRLWRLLLFGPSKMKQYIGPFIFALVINILIIIAILHIHLHLHLHHHNNPRKQPSIVTINLQQLMHSLNQAHSASNTSPTTWLKNHYGKAVSIVHSFKAGKHLKGYVVSLKSNPKERSIIYSVNQGEYFFIGTVIDKDGKNLSLFNTHHYISKPLNKNIFNEAKNLPGIIQGKESTPQAIIIIDPNSNLFPQQWNELAYDITHNLFSVKWVLVNYLKPMGANIAGNILQAKNRISAMNYNAAHYNKNTQTGGYVKNVVLSKQTKETLINNWDFVQKYNLYQLPVTILKSNKNYYVIQGAVMDETLETLFADNSAK